MGLITGILFGFLLQKARVVRYDKQIGALRFQDMTIVKFMMSAIIVSMVGVHFFHIFGLVQLMYKPLVVGENIAGGDYSAIVPAHREVLLARDAGMLSGV